MPEKLEGKFEKISHQGVTRGINKTETTESKNRIWS